MKMRQSQLDAIRRAGGAQAKPKDKTPPAPAKTIAAEPTALVPAKKAPRKRAVAKVVETPALPAVPTAPANNTELVSAIHALGEKMAAIAKEKPQRKPVPYKFTLKRNKQGLLEYAIAEPLTTQ